MARVGKGGPVATRALSIGAILAVKNGPPDMLRSLDPVNRSLSPVITSPLWSAAGFCLLLALAPFLWRQLRGKGVGPAVAALLVAGGLVLLVCVDVWTRWSILPLLVFLALVAACACVVLWPHIRRDERRSRRAEVVDLARVREKREGRRGAGSRR